MFVSRKSLKAKEAFISQNILLGTFLPRFQEVKELENIEQKPLSLRKPFVNRLYEHACRGVRHTNMAFFMCDILGFSEKILKKRNSSWLYDEIVLPLLKTGIGEGNYASDLLEMIYTTASQKPFVGKAEVASKAPRIEVLSFADTVIMYPAISINTPSVFTTPIVQILLLNWAARYLFVEMLCHKVLLRGSVGFGECFISRDPISYLGETIIEVHNTEIIQNWGGVMFSPSATRIIREFKRSVYGIENYKVPVKKDKKSIRLFRKLFPYFKGSNYVMDWTILVELMGKNIDWVKKESENEDLDFHARELNKNTVDYYNYMTDMRQHFSSLVK